MSNKNNENTVSLAAIGEKLKAAREKKGVTIDQAQRQTHIHSTVLLALEGGRSDEVLTPTYVKSFLKKYSSYLGLDPDQSVKEYEALHLKFDAPHANLDFNKADIKERADISGILRIVKNVCLIVVGILILVVAIKGVAHFVKVSHKPSADKTSLRAKNVHGTPAKNAQKKTADKPQIPQIPIPADEPISLVMKVKAEVYVGVKRDGVLLFKRLLPKGTVETVTADGKLDVSIAKARSVELVLNGRPLDIIGHGAIRDLEITRKGIKVK